MYSDPAAVRSLIIRAVRPITPRTRLVDVALDGDFVFRAGQAVMLTRDGASDPIPYSIASPPSAARDGRLEFLMSAETPFGASGDTAALPGRRVEVSLPFGSFGVPADEAHLPLVLIAGGTGIAPIRSVLLDALERQPAVSPMLVYSARTRDEFAFDDEFAALRDRGRLTYHQTITGPDHTGWSGRTGRLDAPLLRAVWPAGDTCTLVCGPAEFVTAVRTALATIGVEPDRVVVER